MNLKSKLKLFILLSCMFSCKSNDGHFIISNESDFDINNVSIMPDANKKIVHIKKGEVLNHNINMSEVKTDGSFTISFQNAKTNDSVSQAFGYYTNGYQIENVISIKVLSDTIIFDSKFDKLY